MRDFFAEGANAPEARKFVEDEFTYLMKNFKELKQ